MNAVYQSDICYRKLTVSLRQGYLGGGVATVFMTLGISYYMCQFPYFVCPIEYSAELEKMTMSCEPSALFRSVY